MADLKRLRLIRSWQVSMKIPLISSSRSKYEPILKSIGPDKLHLPPFTSYEDDRQNTHKIAAPFLSQIYTPEQNHKDTTEDDDATTKRVIGTILLLDQMPRNIYRHEQASIAYQHYDRLARAVVLAFLDPPDTSSTPGKNRREIFDLHPSFRLHPVYRTWLYIPLMHTEYLPYHVLHSKSTSSMKDDVQQAGDEAAVEYAKMHMGFEKTHVEILERFGRYPSRNDALGREWTEEEIEWMEAGGAMFGSKRKGMEEQKREEN
ncbi:hypothetical protein MMC06_000265 [Schaereria dolodes]|nr:hypothetical protein [Schaereria dolodes]